jgi:hypothetical protein
VLQVVKHEFDHLFGQQTKGPGSDIRYICPICGRNRLTVFANSGLAERERVQSQLAEHDRKRAGPSFPA